VTLWAPLAHAATATVNPSQDTTMAADFPDNSSGACDSLFAGNTDNSAARRALLRFDVGAQIPAGSIINSVTLSMAVTRGSNHADATMTLHLVTTPWGEGTDGCGTRGGGQGDPAVNGAATWNSAMHNQTAWGSPGGDYDAIASGSTLVNNTTPVWSSTAAIVSDVQDWLDNPGSNYGWVLIGDEASKTTTRRFDSAEGGSPPALVVDFTPTGDVEACCETNGDCSLTVVGSGTCTGTTLPGIDSCEPNVCAQPIGACCNVDETCSDPVDRPTCEGAGGTFQGGNSACNQGNVDCGLTPFVAALPIPPILQPDNPGQTPLHYTVAVEPATQSVHPNLPATNLWTYNGAWPGATIVAQKGVPIAVTYVNNLPAGGHGSRGSNLLEVDTCAHGPNYYGDSKRIVTHLHGGHVPARFDGQPEYTILPGETDPYEYVNNQEAATLWYHDHALGITRLNVYGGMAGFYLLADAEDTLDATNAFALPSGPYEIGLAIQDRQFNPDGSLFYNAQLEDAFKGNKIVVNGKVWPYLNVAQGKYRFRILNGSQSREYILELKNLSGTASTTTGLVDPRFTLVGTDAGLVSAPIDLTHKFGRIVPAERFDVVIDFAGYPAGTEIVLRNDETTPPLVPNVMKFIVTNQPGYTGTVASTLRPVPPMPEASADITRYFRLAKVTAPCSNDPGRTVNEWLVQSLDGSNGNVIGAQWDDLTDFPILGTREVWEFENPTNVMHPMHVHLVRFQILSKEALDGTPMALKPWEEQPNGDKTWKDIVRVPAQGRVRIIMDFTDYLGRFPQHCHILDHEDHEMMRQYQTTHDPAYCDHDQVCEPGEDCVSCPDDCEEVSGAACGNGLCEAGDGENCLTCPTDCAGKQTGAASKQFCCGAPGGTNSIGCGTDASDSRCIDASANRFCREAPRVRACCGDALCEGAETLVSCAPDCGPCTPTEAPEITCNDGIDNDCDGTVDGPDADRDGVCDAADLCPSDPAKVDPGICGCGVLDTDGDGDGTPDCHDNCPNTGNPGQLDTDGDLTGDACDPDDDDDGVLDASDAFPLDPAASVDTDGDGMPDTWNAGYTAEDSTTGLSEDLDDDDDGEPDVTDNCPVEANADQADCDGDGVGNACDPDFPCIIPGDLAPRGAPDGVVNTADLLILLRLVIGTDAATTQEVAAGDLSDNGILDLPDVLVLMNTFGF
jgi:spore coat protein A